MINSHKYWGLCFVVLCLLVGIVACDNTLDAFDEEKGLYSIYGYLNLDEDINYIRVKDLNSTLSENIGEDIDANVTFENLKTGTTQTLEDTVVEFDGVKTHNFWTTMDIEPDTKYQVSVERSDGRQTSAIATTPYKARTNVNPIAANCTTQVNVNFQPVRSKFGLSVELGFYYKQDLFWVRVNNLLIERENSVTLSIMPIDLISDPFEGRLLCEQLSDDSFEVRYTHYGPDLFKDTVSDTLRIPGGSGRFGAYYKDAFTFPIDTTSLCPPYCVEE